MWKIKNIIKQNQYNYCSTIPTHPKATKKGYVYLHRVLIENELGRQLTEDEIVHHIDNNGHNNVLNNLELMTRKAHTKYHSAGRGVSMVKLKCPNCGTVFIKAKRRLKNSLACCSRRCGTIISYKFRKKGEPVPREKLLESAIMHEFNSKHP